MDDDANLLFKFVDIPVGKSPTVHVLSTLSILSSGFQEHLITRRSWAAKASAATRRKKRAVAGGKYERTRCNALHRRTRQYFSQGLSNPTPTTTKNHLKSRNFGWFAFLYKSLKMAFSNEILMSCIFSIKNQEIF